MNTIVTFILDFYCVTPRNLRPHLGIQKEIILSRNVIDVLEERGFIEQITDTGLREAASTQTLKCYVGFDPTARSLHLGHIIPVMGLAHFQRTGHIPIALVGGGTGMIGDPSGKTVERQLLSKEDVEANARRLRAQLSRFFSFEGPHAALLLNNAEWLLPLKLVDFLRDIGKHFSVNAMIAKESVRWRLEERGQGISFTEFSYMLLQAYDFYHLYEHHGCSVQAGGKDQWGNITAGIDLIRRMSGGSAHGITFPLADHGLRGQDRQDRRGGRERDGLARPGDDLALPHVSVLDQHR